MSALLCLMLFAQSLNLPPRADAELAAKLEALEARRPELQSRRTRASALRISGFVGYTLALVGAGWVLAELAVAAANRPTEPLSGVPPRPLVPPEALAVSALGLFVAGITLHVVARMLDLETDHQEADLDEEERVLRWRYRPDPPD